MNIFYATQAGTAKVRGTEQNYFFANTDQLTKAFDPLDLSRFLCKAPQKSRSDSVPRRSLVIELNKLTLF